MPDTIQQEITVGSAIPAGLVSFAMPSGGVLAYEFGGKRQTTLAQPSTVFAFVPDRITEAMGRVIGSFLPTPVLPDADRPRPHAGAVSVASVTYDNSGVHITYATSYAPRNVSALGMTYHNDNLIAVGFSKKYGTGSGTETLADTLTAGFPLLSRARLRLADRNGRQTVTVYNQYVPRPLAAVDDLASLKNSPLADGETIYGFIPSTMGVLESYAIGQGFGYFFTLPTGSWIITVTTPGRTTTLNLLSGQLPLPFDSESNPPLQSSSGTLVSDPVPGGVYTVSVAPIADVPRNVVSINVQAA